MMTPQPPRDEDDPGLRVSRRTMLRGAVAAALASGFTGSPAKLLGAQPAKVRPEWAEFDDAVTKSFQRLGMVGAAVAVVSADQVLFTRTLGVRDRASGRPITTDTHFLVASTTKSMSSLLVATFVDRACSSGHGLGDHCLQGAAAKATRRRSNYSRPSSTCLRHPSQKTRLCLAANKLPP